MTFSLQRRTRPKPLAAEDKCFWPDAKERLGGGRVTPFVSNYMSVDLFGVERGSLAKQWAIEIESPFDEETNKEMAHVAQYYAVTRRSRLKAKREYLNALTGYLLDLAAKDTNPETELIEELEGVYQEKRSYPKPFSVIARDLGYPRFERVQANPFRMLAEMPLPIYITTSHHEFLEYALAQTQDKEPVSEIFYWGEHLERIPSIFDEDPDWQPSVKRPLVYHLYGLDRYPESIVLAEDDYLDLLDKLAELRYQVRLLETLVQGGTRKRRAIPDAIQMALSGTALLTLGYSITSWEFRVLFRGLIAASGDSRTKRNAPEGVCMQLTPGEMNALKGDVDGIKEYLETYFEGVHFKVYWGSVEACVRDLYNLWRT